jgi:hypothetical protein
MQYFLAAIVSTPTYKIRMIIRICRKEASKGLNINNTVKKVQWTFDSEAENLAERSAVTDSQHIGCVSE